MTLAHCTRRSGAVCCSIIATSVDSETEGAIYHDAAAWLTYACDSKVEGPPAKTCLKERLIQYLSCPSCSGTISLASEECDRGEVITGKLSCFLCKRNWPIIRGVPRFAAIDQVEQDKALTAEKFGWQWQHFTQFDEGYEKQFLAWIAPVTPEFFKDKVVLEGGCGKGRHTQLAAQFGARGVIGIDLGAAVETAFAATRDLPNAHIVQADIFNLPFRRVFDYAFSIGVLH